MEKHIQRFYSLLMENPKELSKIQMGLRKVQNEKDLMDLIDSKIIPLAREKGFEITKEDLLSYERKTLSKLSEEDLQNVSGGISFQNKKIISLFLAGISLSGNFQQMSHAIIAKDVICKEEKNIQNNIDRWQQNQVISEGEDNSEGTGLPEDIIINSTSNIFENELEKTDMQYILDALNLLDPYIYYSTKVTENFRFYDGYKQEISENDENTQLGWDYKKDKGEGSPNFMRCLFPSSAGSLTDAGGSKEFETFSKDCEPTPELIAQIAGYIHNYIRTPNEADRKKAEEDLDNAYSIVNTKGEELSNDEKEKFQNYLKINKGQQHDKNKKYFKTIIYLLKNAKTMIKEQEEDGQNSEKILPKYTTEKMLMSYFIYHFSNNEDVKNFYREAKKVITSSSQIDRQKLKESNERLKSITKILEQIKRNENSPYKEKPQSNSSTKKIKKSEKGVSFSNDTFQDCADITVRHIINLLSYNDAKKWEDIVKEVDINKKDYDEILSALKDDKKVVKEHTLKERLKFFFYYQSKHDNGADAVDIETRSFWNYVISNMDSNVEEGMYKIKYCKEGNELEPGFLNMLKLIYNIAFALKGESEESKSAKTEIDKLESTINSVKKALYEKLDNKKETLNLDKESKKKIKDSLFPAIKNTLELIKKDVEISSLEVREIKIEKYLGADKIDDYFGDCLGSVGINDFKVTQDTNHAWVDYNPGLANTIYQENLKDVLENDKVAQLLSESKFNLNLKDETKISTFNDLFCLGKEKCETNTQFYKNFKVLKFLKNVQIERENNDTIESDIDKCYLESNIKINRKLDTVPVCMIIFKNFIKTREKCEQLLPGVKLDKFLKNNLSDNIFKGKKGKNKNEKVPEFYGIINESNKKVIIWPLSENVEQITIPSTLGNKNGLILDVSVGNFAFWNNKNLKKVKMEGAKGKTLIIEKGTFADSNIEEVEISGEIEKLIIKKDAFKDLDSLKKLKISSTVRELNIEEGGFKGSGLEEFEVSNKVGSLNIGSYAFGESFERLNIGGNIDNLNIGDNAFKESKLNKFETSKKIINLTIGKNAFELKSLETFRLPDSVRGLDIGDRAFIGSSLKEFEIPKNVKRLNIGVASFLNIKSLERLKISDNVEKLSLGDLAFNGTSISEFKVPGKVKEVTIGELLFGNKLMKFDIPDGVEDLNIKDYAFSGTNLNEFIIPSSVKKLTIENGAFKNTKFLETFKIPDKVIDLIIGKNVFEGSSLNEFIIPPSVKKLTIGGLDGKFEIPDSVEELNIKAHAFENSFIKEFKIPKGVKNLNIGDGAFWRSLYLTKVEIPENVEKLTIGEKSFGYAEGLKEFSILGDKKEINIGPRAFYGSNLNKFEIPSNVGNLIIEKGAFKKTALKKLDIPDSIVEKTISESAMN